MEDFADFGRKLSTGTVASRGSSLRSKSRSAKSSRSASIKSQRSKDVNDEMVNAEASYYTEQQKKKEHFRKNKTFLVIKRDMEQRARDKIKEQKEGIPEEHVYYVDKNRAAAVAQGEVDIKVDQKKQRKRNIGVVVSKTQGMVEDWVHLAIMGECELKAGNAERALELLNRAVALDPEDDMVYTTRSVCHCKLHNFQLALTDANKAVKLDPESNKAVMAKGEALYHLGNFEHALVQYNRCKKLRNNAEVQDAIIKATNAISNSLTHCPGFDFKKVAEVIFMISDQFKKERGKEKVRAMKWKGGAVKLKKERKIIPEQEKKRREKLLRKTNKALLGELNTDKEYLECLLKSPLLNQSQYNMKRNNEVGAAVKDTADEALAFLKERVDFWQEHKPVLLFDKKFGQ